MVQGGATGPMTVFYTIVTGITLGAHDAFSRKLKAIGQIEVSSPDLCDYYLAFCPIVSRVGTDIGEAMEKIPDDKQVILVVMHHTINPDSYIGDSSRHVNRLNVILTVDCVFYEGRFYDCNRNQIAFNEVERLVGPGFQIPARIPSGISSWIIGILCTFWNSINYIWNYRWNYIRNSINYIWNYRWNYIRNSINYIWNFISNR